MKLHRLTSVRTRKLFTVAGSTGVAALLFGLAPSIPVFAYSGSLQFAQSPANPASGTDCSTLTGGTAWPAGCQPVVKELNNAGAVNASDSSTVITLSATGGPGTLTCTSNSVTVASGVATFAGCLIDKVGHYQLLATGHGAYLAILSGGFGIAPGTATALQLSGLADTVAGTAQTATVSAVDAGGNVAPSFTGKATFTSTDANAVLPAAYTFVSGDAGSHAFTGGVILKTGGADGVTVTSSGLTSTTQTVLITPTIPSQIAIFPGSTSVYPTGTSGCGSTAVCMQPYTAMAQDGYGNDVSNVTSSTTFSIAPNGSCTAISCGSATTGTHTVHASYTPAGGPAELATSTLGVVAGTANAITMSGFASGPAGTAQTVTVSVATGGAPFTGTVTFSSTDPKAVLPAPYTFALTDLGSHSFSVTPGTAGSQTLFVTDNPDGLASAQMTATITAAATPAVVDLTPANAAVAQGQAQPFVATGYDAYGNLIGDVTSHTSFRIAPDGACLGGSGTGGTAPGNAQCSGRWAGVHTVSGTDSATSPATPLNVLPGGFAFSLDGHIHPFGAAAAPTVTNSDWPGQNIVRGAGVCPDDPNSGYVLDLYGALHPFGRAPQVNVQGYWPGKDIVRGVAIQSCFTGGAGGYVVDLFGAVHPFGNLIGSPVSFTGYWPGYDLIRGITLSAPGSGWVLDAYGGVHPFGDAPPVAMSAYWPGIDVARGIVATGPAGGYVLDLFGGVHPFGNAPGVAVNAYWPGSDIARGLTWQGSLAGGWVVDLYGGLHRFGVAPDVVASYYSAPAAMIGKISS